MRNVTIIVFAFFLGTCSRSPGTLEEVLESGELRVITRTSPTTYFRGAQGFEGPEFMLANSFGEFLSEKYQRPIQVNFITKDRFVDLLPTLDSGEAHLAAAGLPITEENRQLVEFGPVYQEVKQHLIYRLNSGKPQNYDDLQGKHLEVVSGSSFAARLATLQKEHPNLAWAENPNAEISELLIAVNEQKIDYTVADTTSYKVHRYYMPELRVALNLKDDDKLAWAFKKKGSKSLRAEADEFFALIQDNGELEQIKERYYGHINRFDYVGTRTFIKHYDRRLNNYRDLFRQAAETTGIDWRILAAIGYQESHWNPRAVSPTGVRGLMMLTNTTADVMGIDNREDPAQSIPAGAGYFARLKKRLNRIPEPDRTWFALAAYNVGYGHLQDARKITRMQGKDADRWTDVRESLPLLAQRKWYSQVPHGYARGWEPVSYVNSIRTYFEILNWLTLDDDAGGSPEIMADPSLQTAADDVSDTRIPM